MPRYIELNITINDNLQKEILIAQLTEYGVEGFEEEKNLLKAFISEEDFKTYKPGDLLTERGLKFSESSLKTGIGMPNGSLVLSRWLSEIFAPSGLGFIKRLLV